MITCKICGKDFKNTCGFGIHIHKIHNISSKDYYDCYIKSKNEGICLLCGQPTKFHGFSKGYAKHCSTKCASMDPTTKQKVEQTCLDRYGATNVYASEYGKKKCKESKLNKYGDEWYHNTEQAVKTYKETVKNRSAEQTLSIGRKISESYHNLPEERKKEIANKISKAQVNYYKSLTDNEYVKLCDKRHIAAISRSKESLAISNLKSLKTKISNNTINSSPVEDEFYNKLLTIFDKSDIERQYFDEVRYPYACDFYIKPLDMFIEINNHWTHGTHPFDANNSDDIKILNRAIERSNYSDFYTTFIYVWTDLDIRKYKTAIKNKLNYMRLYSINEMDETISQLKELIE